ncbi:MAG TPA: 2-nitropropane dioxygenase, partial [Syntrophomonas sp.]|nr:2-nitropropane dioxygenase [Syntrophomonas sp.]
YLNARQEDVIIIKSPVGLPGRAIKNTFTDLIAAGDAPMSEECEACLRHCSGDYCIKDALLNARNGRVEEGVVFSGANVYKIKSILPVAQIFENILLEFSLA